MPILKRALAARNTPEALYRDLASRLRDATLPTTPGWYGGDERALTPTERLVGAAKALGLRTEPFGEFARVYSERLYSTRSGTEIVRPYEDALREFRRLPRWRRFLGAINPTSVLLPLKRKLARRASRAHPTTPPEVARRRRSGR
ncbi:hypothetical protein GBA65_21240 (plasmid) [Rubrobacter marinus]|uniref:DUF4129 domain-containing protein n=1 Tax=Rubrobacter marinus TaxID=2653852 RepID=A0A6G8Q3G1_9ACTN|nr:hypothetical protein [Rubrobacter marinus]QIN80985.1 hypothetical protein GBA65_21240 [Rubrobacter marinus]